MSDPRGGTFIVDGEGAAPIHVDDMSAEQRAKYLDSPAPEAAPVVLTALPEPTDTEDK